MGGRILGNMRRRRVERQMERILAGYSEGLFC
jgi:hypothetical protein